MGRHKDGTLGPGSLRVYRFIQRWMSGVGYAPTVREIGAGLDMASTNGVRWHLGRLERAGLIERDRVVARGIRITEGREAGEGANGTKAADC